MSARVYQIDLDPALAELVPLLERVTFDTFEVVTFFGVPFQFFLCKATAGEPPAWYHRSAETRGFEVYVIEDFETERKRLIFHEVVEASLVFQQMDMDDADQFAREQEEALFGPRPASLLLSVAA